jgi:hypothetical protein
MNKYIKPQTIIYISSPDLTAMGCNTPQNKKGKKKRKIETSGLLFTKKI